MSQVMQFPIEIGGDLALDSQIESDHIDTAEAAISGIVSELFIPTVTAESIAMWEKRCGVSAVSGDSLATRVARVAGAYSARGGQSRAYFIGMAAKYGVTITITDGEYPPFRAGYGVAGDPVYSSSIGASEHTWTVHGISEAAAQAIGMAQAFESLKPAHTDIVWSEV